MFDTAKFTRVIFASWIAGWLLLASLGVSFAQEAPRPFSANLNVTVADSRDDPSMETRTEVAAALHFDGKHRWRIDSIQLRSRRPGSVSSWVPASRTDFLIGDSASHSLYNFLSHALLPGIFYHEYDIGPLHPHNPEAHGLDDWTLFDPANPCAAAPGLTCKKLGIEDVRGSTCVKWLLTNPGRTPRTTRTVWIDQTTGITLRSDVSEEQLNPPGTIFTRHTTLELTGIQAAPQDPGLFELVSGNGMRVRTASMDAENLRGPSSNNDETYTFRSGAREVLVDVSVRDGKGHLLPELKRSDFRLFADGVERPISGFWFDESPIAVALVVDSSISMTLYIRDMQRTAEAVLSKLKPQDKVALFALDQSVDRLEDLTTDRKRVAAKIGRVPFMLNPAPCEGHGVPCTDVVNALFVATLYLKRNAPEMRRVIILVSDNVAGTSMVGPDRVFRDQDELIDTALQTETVIYDLAVGTAPRPCAQAVSCAHVISMDKITRETGGEMIRASSAGKMLEEVVQALRKRYLISFKPAQREPDGRTHTISLQLTSRFERPATYTIRHRRSYRTLQVNDSEVR